MINQNSYRVTIILCMLFLLSAASALAVRITPETQDRLISEGNFDKYVNLMKDARSRGVDMPDEVKTKRHLAMADDDIDTLNLLVLLVDFIDNRYYSGDVAAAANDFDSILFSVGRVNPTGSMTEYYMENSYGKFFIRGEVHGWYLMPETYSYYVNDSTGTGHYPQNSQGLVIDAVNVADSLELDFSPFDTYGGSAGPDNEIDGLLIVHAGPGYQQTGDQNHIQAHKWELGAYKFYVDGLLINSYTIQSEELYGPGDIQPIGVFCHEFGHILGLPDLYDVDYEPSTSVGVGRWSLMAVGVYNGNSRVPAHFDAWSKAFIGFVEPVEVYSNMVDVEFPQVETEPVVYKLWLNGQYGPEYFLVENRQKVGFDYYLPGSGLLIYHVDDATTFNNVYVNHYHVAVEQADGLFELEYSANKDGDAGDPWPGNRDKRSFDDLSLPSSRGYGNVISQVSVWNISDSGSIITANLDISWSRPHFELKLYDFADEGNDGIMEPGETVEFYFDIKNSWLTANNAVVTLSVNDSSIQFIKSSVSIAVMPGDGSYTGNYGDPIIFKISDTITPTYDSFFVTIESDGGLSDTSFIIEKQIGNPQVLIVDDDRGASYNTMYVNDLYRKRIPADYWSKQLTGSPPGVVLNQYNIVIWFTGDTSSDLLQPADIDAIEYYLNNNGSLFLTGQGIAGELHVEDSIFLEDYLRARYDGLAFFPQQIGVNGSPIGDGLNIRYFSGCNQQWDKAEKIIPVNGAVPAFAYKSIGGYTALSFDGPYKLVFFDWGFEAMDNNSANFSSRDTVLYNILQFFASLTTEVADENNRHILPDNFTLEQNCPNPFNPVTTIKYSLKSTNGASMPNTMLKVFNVLGREIRTLVNEKQKPGEYMVKWDGKNDAGNQVASGIYFYSLQRGESRTSKKMILLK